MNKDKQDRLRKAMETEPGFTEKSFARLVKAMNKGDKATACREIRAIRERGLNDAYHTMLNWW